jgi:hypothetical protein
MSGVDADGNIIDVTPTANLSASGNDPSVIYRQQESIITLAENTEISAYRATGWVSINLNGHDLVVGSGIFGTGMANHDVKVYDNAGGGRLVFGGQDIFMNFENNKPVISAPMAWRRPEGNTSVGPSLYILGNHWQTFQFLGNDEIGNYNNILVGKIAQTSGQKVFFGGDGDRIIHGALIGICHIEKKGYGAFHIKGSRYPLYHNGGCSVDVQQGRWILDHNNTRDWDITVKSNAVLEIGADFNAELGCLRLNDGSILAGSGTIKTVNNYNQRDLRPNSWLSPGSRSAIGELKISASGNDAQFKFKSGAGFKIKISEDEADCINLCAPWHYLTMPREGETFNLELFPLGENPQFNPKKEYRIFYRSNSTGHGNRFNNMTAFTWNISTTHPKVIDVSKTSVICKDNGYYLTGVRNVRPGLTVIVR